MGPRPLRTHWIFGFHNPFGYSSTSFVNKSRGGEIFSGRSSQVFRCIDNDVFDGHLDRSIVAIRLGATSQY